MKNILIISLTFILFSACDNKDDVESFVTADIVGYNKQILGGIKKQEDWVKTPLLIINKLLGPEYNSEGHGTYVIEQYEKDNYLTIIVTQEGLLDDCVFGEKRIIDFNYLKGVWIISKIRVGFKCYEHRGGHVNYSGQGCP